jgi:ammonia channel protein AmtB
MKLIALLAFMSLWSLIVYTPIAYSTWNINGTG